MLVTANTIAFGLYEVDFGFLYDWSCEAFDQERGELVTCASLGL